MKNILIVVIVLILAVLGYKYLQPNTATTDSAADTNASASTTVNTSTEPTESDAMSIGFDDIAPTYVDLGPSESSDIESVQPAVTTSSFSCDGRQHCSQMTSCAEATYFSNNCPNTKMDGNNDGVPCEQQWCQ